MATWCGWGRRSRASTRASSGPNGRDSSHPGRRPARRRNWARRTTERQSALQRRGFASDQALDAAELGLDELTARQAEIDAALAALDVRLEKATLTAPFTGQVAARRIDAGSIAGAGQPVVSIVETAKPEFRVGISPSALPAFVAAGTAVVHVGGAERAAALHAVLPELDAATRTRTVVLRLPESPDLAFRETGFVVVPEYVETRGAWVPIAALEDGPRGLWRLLTLVDEDGKTVVGTETVEILFADAERAFVRGSFRDGARFVADGTHRVVPGQVVRVGGAAG